MFWTFLIVIAIGTILVKLGAMYVMLSLLLSAFNAALLVIIILVVMLVWRRHKIN